MLRTCRRKWLWRRRIPTHIFHTQPLLPLWFVTNIEGWEVHHYCQFINCSCSYYQPMFLNFADETAVSWAASFARSPLGSMFIPSYNLPKYGNKAQTPSVVSRIQNVTGIRNRAFHFPLNTTNVLTWRKLYLQLESFRSKTSSISSSRKFGQSQYFRSHVL